MARYLYTGELLIGELLIDAAVEVLVVSIVNFRDVGGYISSRSFSFGSKGTRG